MKLVKLNTYIEFLVLIVVVLVFGTAAHRRNLVWKDELSLWSNVVKNSPAKPRVLRSYFKTSRYCIKGGESHIYCIFDELEN